MFSDVSDFEFFARSKKNDKKKQQKREEVDDESGVLPRALPRLRCITNTRKGYRYRVMHRAREY